MSQTVNPLELIRQEKLVVIARNAPADIIGDLARALLAGGVRLLESTFNQSLPDPIADNRRTIELLCREFGGELCVGAGTVLTVAQVQAAYEAGARYIISPNTNPAVIAETRRLGLVSIPGAMTPTEIAWAWELGAHMVKVFPADDLGFHYLRNVAAPLSHIPFMATGGVNPQTIPEFLAAGVISVGTGISILKPDLVKARDYAAITRLATEHVAAIRNWRSPS